MNWAAPAKLQTLESAVERHGHLGEPERSGQAGEHRPGVRLGATFQVAGRGGSSDLRLGQKVQLALVGGVVGEDAAYPLDHATVTIHNSALRGVDTHLPEL